MMIDIHTHYGEIEGGYHMPLEMQLEAMEAYGIDYALISNIECGIFHEGIEGNRKMLEMVRVHQDRLGCMLWCCENLTAEQKILFEEMYLQNQNLVKGLKIHPDIAGRRADDVCFAFYYEMGERYRLPILLHTQESPYSKMEYVVRMAKKYPNTILILGHMGLGSDGKEALEAIKEYDNIFGDTAWVRPEVVRQAEKMGISHKIMFGTDSPISGARCYGDDHYIGYYACKSQYIKGVMAENAGRIF